VYRIRSLSVEDVHFESDHIPYQKLGYLILYKVTKSLRVREKLVLLAQARAVLPRQQSPSLNSVENLDLKLEVVFETVLLPGRSTKICRRLLSRKPVETIDCRT
jgi:hypothetical protein